MPKSHKWTIRFAVLTPVLVIICMFLIGGGHGWYTSAIVLFPWATLNTAWQNHLSEQCIFVGLLQFILYGFLIDITKNSKAQILVLVGILVLHVTLTILILTLRNPEWR